MTKIILTLLLLTNTVYAQMYTDTDWEKQKYSMFIHWGLYSQLGGVWNGEPVRQGYREQIQSHGGIFSDYYASVARQFTADKWNPDTIAQLAKKAGMKSIVFTSKPCPPSLRQTKRHTPAHYRRRTPKQYTQPCNWKIY